MGLANALPSGTAVTIGPSGDGVLLNGFDQTIGSLQSVTGGTAGFVALGGATLTVGNSASTTFAGSITGPGSLVKQVPAHSS